MPAAALRSIARHPIIFFPLLPLLFPLTRQLQPRPLLLPPSASQCRTMASSSTTTSHGSFVLTSDLHAPPVQIDLASPSAEIIDQKTLLSFTPFRKWLSKFSVELKGEANPDGYELTKITVTDVNSWVKGRINFLKLTAEELHSYEVLLLLYLSSYTLRAHQNPTSTPSSQSNPVSPAGMLDDSGSFSGAAAKELEEEVGLKIPADKLIPLSELAINSSSGESEDGFYTSPGLLDEVITFHAYVHEIEEKEMEQWKGKLTGLRDEGEKITLKIVKLDDLWRETRDVKALCAWGLWKALSAEGKVGV